MIEQFLTHGILAIVVWLITTMILKKKNKKDQKMTTLKISQEVSIVV